MNIINRIFIGLFLISAASFDVSAQEVGELNFSTERGYYDNPFLLSLTCNNPDATIRYTINGTRPDPTNGITYTTPIPVNTTYFIRAIAYNSVDTTEVETHTYIFLDDVITSPVMDEFLTTTSPYAPLMRSGMESLPAVSIVTGNPNDTLQVVDFISQNEQETSIELLYHDNTPNFQINAGIKESGSSTASLPKRAYRLYFSSEYGASKMSYPLFNDYSEGLEPVEKFDRLQLRSGSDDAMTASFSNYTLYMRQRFMENIQLELGEVSPHGRFMHVYVNGEYYGQWHLQERPDAHFHEAYYGGDKCDYDVINKETTVGSCADANTSAWEAAYSVRNDYNAIQQYVDVENLANYALMNIWSGGNSGGDEDVMYGRRRESGEQFHFYCWDSDRIWYNLTANMVNLFAGQSNPRGLFIDLVNTHDDYRMLVADRAYCMFFNDGVLTPAKNIERLQKIEEQIQGSIITETARWGNAEQLLNWENRLSYMYNTYFPQRTALVVSQLRSEGIYPTIAPPIFNSQGGLVQQGFNIDMANPNADGDIYYTTNGTDPRMPGGGISSNVQPYTGGITVESNAFEIKARVLYNDEWSAMCPVAFYPLQNYAGIMINEINYHPGEACEAGFDGVDFIEITNAGNAPVDISGTKFTVGINYTFPVGTILEEGAYLVLAEDKNSFTQVYGFSPFGQYSGDLDNGGELIKYTNFDQSVVIDSVSYDDVLPWAEAADGQGSSIELIDTSLDNTFPENWQASGNFCGSPNAININSCNAPIFTIIINEVNYNPGPPNSGDWLELYNPNGTSVDMSGWQLRDEDNVYTFPNGTQIDVNGYLVLAEHATFFSAAFPLVNNYIGSLNFGFSGGGELLTLLDNNACLIDQVDYDDDPPWVNEPDINSSTLSLVDPTYNNDLATSWVPSSQSGAIYGTPGAPNNIPAPCNPEPEEIIITELNYNPDSLNNTGDWIELYNPNSYTVDISGWRVITENDGCTIPVSTYIPAEAYLVISENASLFNEVFPNTPNYVLGIGLGLSKGGEQVQLLSPTSCVVDSLTYDDDMPWDTIPDGNGMTLSLVDFNSDNTQPPAWENSGHINAPYGTPGRPNAPCPDIKIRQSGFPCVGNPIKLSADALYPEMTYEWVFEGTSISNSDAESETLIWDNIGRYDIQLITTYFECTDTASYVVNIVNVCNQSPIAVADAFTLIEDNSYSDNILLNNDSDPEGDSFYVNTTPIPPPNGTVNIAPDGSFTYMPNPDFFGLDSFSYEICDIVSIDSFARYFFNHAVSGGGEDVEENQLTGLITDNSTDLDLSEDDGNTFIVGIRITDIIIPDDAIITNAFFEFKADESQSVATSVNISAEAIGDAAAIPTIAYGLSSKPRTSASVNWNPEPWTTGSIYTTANIAPIIRELTDRADWSSGNAITFIFEGTGTRTAESYDGTYPPVLHIQYQLIDGTMTGSSCDTAQVNINVSPVNDPPMAVNDLYATSEDISFTSNLLNNDINLDNDNLNVDITPVSDVSNGSLFIISNGFYAYTPDPDFFGIDSFQYEVCDDANPSLCDTATVMINVTPVNDAPIATPDTITVYGYNTFQTNILQNDNDIDNDDLFVNTSAVTMPTNGVLNIQSDGTINYQPNAAYLGTDQFTYEVCDDGIPIACNTTTVTIYVEPACIDIELYAWLEGAYDAASNTMNTILNTERGLLPGQTPISEGLVAATPSGQPYNRPPWNYTGTEGNSWTDTEYTAYSNTIVDWVLVSFRTDIDSSTEIKQAAALLHEDGSISFTEECILAGTHDGQYIHVVIEHRNHMGVMTPEKILISNNILSYDFRNANSYKDATSFGQKEIKFGIWSMYAGDADQSDFPSYDISGQDKTPWEITNGIFDQYQITDFNMDGDVNGADKIFWFNNNGISSRVPK